MARWTGYALLIGAIPVASVMGAFMDSNNVDRVMEVVSLIAYSMIVVGLIVLILYRSPLRAAYISPTHGYFLGAGNDFLNALSAETNRDANPYSQ